jgi:protein ImuB
MTKPEPKYACIYAREFAVQTLLRLRPELRVRPCAVMDGDPPLEEVCSLNDLALSLHVTRGMSRAEMDSFPSVTVLQRSLAEETAARTAILECAGAFSPRVEDCSRDNTLLCVIDIAGTEKLFGPSTTLGATILQCMHEQGIMAVVAISSNFHAAISSARGMSPRAEASVISPGSERDALSSLPLSVLDMTLDQAETFSSWGIRTLGMLAALPEQALIARMGQQGRRLRELACGGLPHLFVPLEAPVSLVEHIAFETPVELLDSVLFVVNVMLEQLILRAVARVLALASVTIVLQLERDASHIRTVRPAIPANDRQLWLKLIQLDLEAHPPQAAILSLTVAAESGTTPKTQRGLFSPMLPEPLRLDITLARIRAIVGDGHVGRPVLSDTHKPGAFCMEPFTSPTGSSSTPKAKQFVAAQRQLRPPETIAVILRGDKPARFVFRGKDYEVEHAYGPWLASGDWWRPDLWGIQQWDLVARSEGACLLCCCIVRDPVQSCWQMMAVYD